MAAHGYYPPPGYVPPVPPSVPPSALNDAAVSLGQFIQTPVGALCIFGLLTALYYHAKISAFFSYCWAYLEADKRLADQRVEEQRKLDAMKAAAEEEKKALAAAIRQETERETRTRLAKELEEEKIRLQKEQEREEKRRLREEQKKMLADYRASKQTGTPQPPQADPEH